MVDWLVFDSCLNIQNTFYTLPLMGFQRCARACECVLAKSVDGGVFLWELQRHYIE